MAAVVNADGELVSSLGRADPSRAIPRIAALAWSGVLAIGALAVWFSVVGLRALLAAGNLHQALLLAQGRTVGPGILALIAGTLVAERHWPAVRRRFGRPEIVDAAYLGLFMVAVVPGFTLVETGCAIVLSEHAGFLVLSQIAFVPRLVVVGLLLVGMDAMNWLCHVANHRFSALWRLHALHHSQEEMGVLTTFRTHPLVHVTYLPAILPALILGASGTVPGAALVVYGCLITLPHANLRWRFGPLGRIVVSPAYHRLHHAATSPGDGRAVNFGFVLVCWDWLARRAVFPTPDTVAVPTGIAGRPVPVEQALTTSRLTRLVAAQLAQPFRVRTKLDGAS